MKIKYGNLEFCGSDFFGYRWKKNIFAENTGFPDYV